MRNMGERDLMMKVLRLTPHYYYTPDVVNGWIVRMDQMGGMQTQIYRQSLALAKKGVRQIILPIAMASAPKVWKPYQGITVIRGNIPMIPIKSKVRGTVGLNIYWGIGVLKHIATRRKHYKNFDIIHAHCSGVASPLIVGLLAKKCLRLPLIYTVHCCRVSTYHPMSKLDALINDTVIKIEKHCLDKADKVILLTDRTRKIVQSKYDIPESKTVVIPDLINTEDFLASLNSQNITKFNSNYNISTHKKHIVFVGRIAYEKGCFILLDAFRKINDTNCELVYYGDGNERQMLESKIKEYGLQSRCRVTGYLPNNEICLAINSASFIVMPSLHEEFGGLLLEIAAVGKGVIASNAGGIPSIVKDGVSGIIFENGDSNNLAQKIEFALNNLTLLDKMGERLHSDVLKTFSFDSNIDLMLEQYNKLIMNK